MYKNRVFSTIYRYVHDSSIAEDLAQDVFIKVWKKARTFKGRSKFSTWLYRIVVNHCLSYQTKRKRDLTVQLDESVADDSVNAEEIYEKEKRAQMLRDAVGKLSERQRIALILFKFENYTCAEVAKIMDISFPACQSLIFRAIENLRKKLT